MIHPSLDWIHGQLDALREQGLLRQLRLREVAQGPVVEIRGRKLINFGSNDYLHLAADPRLGEAVVRAIRDQHEGWGSGASPLVTGYGLLHQQLEQRLAKFEGTEAALLFTSGYAANAGTIAALVGPGDTVFTDRKNHASLLDGCRLSRADVRAFPHGDWQRLADLLARSQTGRRLIASDSLFSMDGDVAPLAELADLADRYDAMLLLDEAHATGIFGAHGRGLAEQAGLEERIPVRIGTLSKALGCLGGFVCGSRPLIEWLLNRARPYVFSTAAPGAAAAAAICALDVVRDEPHRRRELLARAENLRTALAAQGWNLGSSTTQIIPVMVGEAERAVALSSQLAQRGIFVPAIRPPTVPEGESLLRISLTYGHSEEMIGQLVEALRR